MNARHSLLLAALAVSLPLCLAACGNKGPLVMPEDAEPVIETTTSPGLVPVETRPDQALPEDEPASALPDPTAVDPLLDQQADPVDDPRIPIDPATVPDSPPATETVDDADG